MLAHPKPPAPQMVTEEAIQECYHSSAAGICYEFKVSPLSLFNL